MDLYSFGQQARAAPAERSDRLMGTDVAQRVYGLHAGRCAALTVSEIARLEQLWSVYRSQSAVSELGRCSGVQSIAVDPDTSRILSMAKRFSEITGGAFDVTAAPFLALWSEAEARGHLPGRAEVERLLRLVDSRDIELSPGPRAFLRQRGQRVDLGGIGKGYAADRCVELYRQNGIRHALINLGGNVAVLGRKPDGAPWRVGIQAPYGPRGDWVGYLDAEDCSIVTSGSYERYFEIAGIRYSHIINPLTGVPVMSDAASVTVVSKSSARGDALATACMVLGVEKSLALIRKVAAPEGLLGALLIDTHGQVYLTSDLEERFHRGERARCGASSARA
jgi:thiamine biosynthesis lipoprotein